VDLEVLPAQLAEGGPAVMIELRHPELPGGKAQLTMDGGELAWFQRRLRLSYAAAIIHIANGDPGEVET
jgi:hypothetical protein